MIGLSLGRLLGLVAQSPRLKSRVFGLPPQMRRVAHRWTAIASIRARQVADQAGIKYNR